VIEVAGEVTVRIEVVAFTALAVIQEVAMGKTAEGEMRVEEEAKEEDTRTSGVVGTQEEALMPAMDSLRRMRRRILALRMHTSTLPLRAVRKPRLRRSNKSTPMPSRRSCLSCLRPRVCNRWQPSPAR
jgi:hypothetical protein